MTTAAASVNKFEEKLSKVAHLVRERVSAPEYPHKKITVKLMHSANRDGFDNDFVLTSEILKNPDMYYELDPELFFMVTQRPSWETAPEWANFLTGSKDGFWCWHEKRPTFQAFDMFNPVARMKTIDTGLKNAFWRRGIFERPVKVEE